MTDTTETSAFRIDVTNLCVWRRNGAGADERLVLTPKTFDVLRYLVENSGRLVSHDELLTALWRDIHVQPEVLKSYILAIRNALGDKSSNPRFIATQRGRGYRFIGPVSSLSVASLESGSRPEEERLDATLNFGGASQPASPDTNLPQPLTKFIGRDAELVELQECLARNRLVTLIGPGGVGKTRLAVELGRRVLGHFPQGVWLIDLAPVADPALVVSATATGLGVVLGGAEASVEAIAAMIANQRRLLIFDNCEYVIDATGALIEALLQRAPALSVIATSQENLHISAEQIYRLRPLALPPPSATEIAGFGAVALFVERARYADRDFALDARNAGGVAEICRHLDGIPLALEMAASRLPLLGVNQLRANLDERFRLLKADQHLGEIRHRTLRDTVEWSHGLLDQSDKRVFRRLAVFAGTFSLDAAAAVSGADDADRWDIVDILGRLTDKSLLTLEHGEQPRYRLLETLRLYARERLKASGEFETVTERHARYFTELFDQAYAAWETAPDTELLRIYRPEIDNIRAALDWALADPDRAQIAVALAGAAALLMTRLGLVTEGKRYTEQAMPLIDAETPPAVAARLLRQTALLRYYHPRALPLLEQSAALYRQVADQPNLGATLANIGGLYTNLGRNEEAKAVLSEAYDLLISSDHKRALYNVLNIWGTLSLVTNDYTEARRLYTSALDLARELEDVPREGNMLLCLAEVEFNLGNVGRAIELGRDAVISFRSTPGQRPHLALSFLNLASYLIVQGDPLEARPFAAEALSVAQEEGGYVVRVLLQLWALLGALEGRPVEAARLIGFVDAGFASGGEIQQGTEQLIHDRLMELLKTELPSAEIEACAAEGAEWSEARAVAYAFEHLVSPETSMPGWSPGTQD
jgi:predicted ATPase/DNA-binding winged helix-turn-helix (wHTH) protein